MGAEQINSLLGMLSGFCLRFPQSRDLVINSWGLCWLDCEDSACDIMDLMPGKLRQLLPTPPPPPLSSHLSGRPWEWGMALFPVCGKDCPISNNQGSLLLPFNLLLPFKQFPN